MNTAATLIRSARHAAGLTRHGVAARTGVAQSNMARAESGTRDVSSSNEPTTSKRFTVPNRCRPTTDVMSREACGFSRSSARSQSGGPVSRSVRAAPR